MLRSSTTLSGLRRLLNLTGVPQEYPGDDRWTKVAVRLEGANLTRKLKIAFVLGGRLSIGGGAERLIQNLVRHIPEAAYDVTILQTENIDVSRLTAEEIAELSQRARIITVPGYLQRFDFFSKTRLGAVVQSALILPLASLIVRRLPGLDSLSYLDSADFVYLVPNNMCRLVGSSKALVIGTNHNEFSTSSLENRVLCALIRHRVWYRRIDGFVLYPVNRDLARYLRRSCNSVIPNGVDTTVFHSSRNSTNHPLRFLYVARLTPCKGLMTVLRAWDNSTWNGTAELHVVGGGPLQHELLKPRKRSTVYHGVVPTSELAKLYRDSDVFLFPSDCDAFGIAVLEALASGLQVIVTDKLRGTFDDFERMGCLEYAPNDVSVYSQILTDFMSGKKKVRAPDEMARKIIEAKFEWRVVTESLLTFLLKAKQSSEGSEVIEAPSSDGQGP